MDAMINGNNVANCVTTYIGVPVSQSKPFKLHYNFKPFYWLIADANSNSVNLNNIPSVISNYFTSESSRSAYQWYIDDSRDLVRSNNGWTILKIDDFNYSFQPYNTTSSQPAYLYVTAVG